MSEEPGVCIEADCTKHGEPLAECECEDAMHEEAGEAAEESEE